MINSFFSYDIWWFPLELKNSRDDLENKFISASLKIKSSFEDQKHLKDVLNKKSWDQSQIVMWFTKLVMKNISNKIWD